MLSSLCKENDCSHVVDIGAGLGHLSRLLSFNNQLRVTTVEATDSHSPKAQRLDRLVIGEDVNKFIVKSR